MPIPSRRVPDTARTKCGACGDNCPYDEHNIGAHRVWARRHIEANPTHEVYVVVMRARIYSTERNTP